MSKSCSKFWRQRGEIGVISGKFQSATVTISDIKKDLLVIVRNVATWSGSTLSTARRRCKTSGHKRKNRQGLHDQK